ncbi:recombinase RecA [bacterium]|nr:MAG: recombinase RecA [bacterium]
MDEEKTKAIDLALSQIDKQFGKGSIMRMKDGAKIKVEVIPTGCLGLDAALGIGGLPRGRIIEISGPESHGKTTLSLHAIAEAQKLGDIAAFIDVEHSLDLAYANNLGVNVDGLLLSQPDYAEMALEIVETLVRSNGIGLIVIDSVAALVPRSEIEGEMGASQMGVQARLMSQAMRKLTGAVSKSNTCVIFINQIREKLMVVFGNNETTPGGRALKFYSSIRLDVRRIGSIKEGETITGNRTVAKIVKNKLAPPYRKAEFDIIYGKGIDTVGNILDLADEAGIIDKSGSWYSYKDIKLGQGKSNASDYLRNDEKVFKEVETKVKEWLGLK